MELPQHIEIRPDVMLGSPCLKGTRIPVYLILEKLGAGETTEQILSAYPQFTKATSQQLFSTQPVWRATRSFSLREAAS